MTLSTNENMEKKRKETMNAPDNKTMNEDGICFSIYEYGKKSSISTKRHAHEKNLPRKYPFNLKNNIATCTKWLQGTHRTFRY